MVMCASPNTGGYRVCSLPENKDYRVGRLSAKSWCYTHTSIVNPPSTTNCEVDDDETLLLNPPVYLPKDDPRVSDTEEVDADDHNIIEEENDDLIRPTLMEEEETSQLNSNFFWLCQFMTFFLNYCK